MLTKAMYFPIFTNNIRPYILWSSVIGTPTANETLEAEFERETTAWAEVNVDASEREDKDSGGLQREFTREEVKKCVANFKSIDRKVAGADQTVNQLIKCGGEGMLTMMVML